MRVAPVIAITGGVASGKTSFCQYLYTFLENAEWFNVDAYVSELLDQSEEVRMEIRKILGKEVYVDGKLDRTQVRFQIFSDPRRRNQLEHILHPRIQKMWMAKISYCKAVRCNFLAEAPLLYETGWEVTCDFIIVVACSFSTQLQRLVARGICKSLAYKIITTQLPTGEKMRRAHEVVWNNGPIRLMLEQASMTANYLTERYG